MPSIKSIRQQCLRLDFVSNFLRNLLCIDIILRTESRDVFTNRIKCIIFCGWLILLLILLIPLDSPLRSVSSFLLELFLILSRSCPFHLLNAVIFYNVLSGSKVKYMIERHQALRFIAESNSTQIRLRRMTWIISFIAKGHLFKNSHFNSSTFSIVKNFWRTGHLGYFLWRKTCSGAVILLAVSFRGTWPPDKLVAHAVKLSGSVVLMFSMSGWMLMLFIPVLVLMSVSRAVSTFLG